MGDDDGVCGMVWMQVISDMCVAFVEVMLDWDVRRV